MKYFVLMFIVLGYSVNALCNELRPQIVDLRLNNKWNFTFTFLADAPSRKSPFKLKVFKADKKYSFRPDEFIKTSSFTKVVKLLFMEDEFSRIVKTEAYKPCDNNRKCIGFLLHVKINDLNYSIRVLNDHIELWEKSNNMVFFFSGKNFPYSYGDFF